MNIQLWEQEPTRYDKEYKYFDGQLRIHALTKQTADEKVIDLGEYFYNGNKFEQTTDKSENK